MVNCWAFGCSNRSESGMKMHSFPTDTARRELWVLKVKRLDPNSNPRAPKLLQPSKYAKLCTVRVYNNNNNNINNKIIIIITTTTVLFIIL